MPKDPTRDGSVWARFRRRLRSHRVRVRDDSMRPTLEPGDRLYVDPRPTRPIRRGDLVVVHDPERPGLLLIKRVGDAPGHRAPDRGQGTGLYLVADNPGLGRDSRNFGPVDRARVVGVAWFRYAPTSRRTLLVGTLK